jgi:uncharacterized protein with PhoU and TrkA domain
MKTADEWLNGLDEEYTLNFIQRVQRDAIEAAAEIDGGVLRDFGEHLMVQAAASEIEEKILALLPARAPGAAVKP